MPGCVVVLFPRPPRSAAAGGPGTATAPTTGSGLGTTITRGSSRRSSAAGCSPSGAGSFSPTMRTPVRRLWTAQIDRQSRCASLEDGVDPAGVNRCVIYDPATGRRLHAYPFQAESGRQAHATAIRVAGDVIAIAAAKQVPGEWGHVWEGTSPAGPRRRPNPLDPAGSGRISLPRPGAGRRHAVFGRVAVASPGQEDRRDYKTGRTLATAPFHASGFGRSLGKTRWLATTANRNYADPEAHTAGIRDSDDWLGYCREQGILLTGKTSETLAFDAKRCAAVARADRRLADDSLRSEVPHAAGPAIRRADRQTVDRG